MTEEVGAAARDPDARLMLRFKEGDVEAFECLFARHVRSLVNFAYRFVRNRQAAEDMAQEIFLRVHDAAPTYQAQARFTTWLYRIASNVCLNELRRPHLRVVHQSIEGTRSSANDCDSMELTDKRSEGPDKILERQAISAALRRALEQLPDKQRMAFILNKYQEFSYAEVGDIMGITEKAVKSLIHRAKVALAEKLKPLLPELL
jgi:RNA polymerase sigma-70 factor (ECF subfamily)